MLRVLHVATGNDGEGTGGAHGKRAAAIVEEYEALLAGRSDLVANGSTVEVRATADAAAAAAAAAAAVAATAGDGNTGPKNSQKSVAALIGDYAFEQGAHYVACGVDGTTALNGGAGGASGVKCGDGVSTPGIAVLGSISDAIVKDCPCTVVLVKR